MSYKMKEIPEKERPRERLKIVGASNITDKELLSILLKTGTKQKNVEEVALDVLKVYPLYDLQDVSIQDLRKINGIGEVKALELLAAVELGRRIFLKQKEELKKLTSPDAIWLDSKYLFSNIKQEHFYCLYFNHKQELIERKLLFMGTLNCSTVHPREIFKEACRVSASSIICMHNHPSNDITPSKEDILLTEKLMKIGAIQGIPVVDHIIIGNDSFYSFYEHKNILNL